MNAFAGEQLPEPLHLQAILPPWLGGTGIRAMDDAEAAATFVAAWMTAAGPRWWM